MRKKKIATGPKVTTKTEPVEVTPAPVPEVEAVEPPTPVVQEDVATDKLYPTVEDEAMPPDEMMYKPYTAGNTAQHKIPVKYKVWGAIATVIAVILGIWIACSHTSLPVSIMPVVVECDANAGTALVKLDDLEHIKVDVFRNNVLVTPKQTFTPDGILYSDLAPGMYTFHTLEVQRSFIKYGVTSGVLPAPANYTSLTDAVKDMVAKLPDEGNKKDICELLAGSFITASESSGDVAQIERALKDRNAVILGFVGTPKLQDESVWYDLLKQNGTIHNYMKNNNIVVNNDNYKGVFLAIAKGFKENI